MIIIKERLVSNFQEQMDIPRHNSECPNSTWDKKHLVPVVLHSVYQSIIYTWTEIFFTLILSKFSTDQKLCRGKGETS